MKFVKKKVIDNRLILVGKNKDKTDKMVLFCSDFSCWLYEPNQLNIELHVYDFI